MSQFTVEARKQNVDAAILRSRLRMVVAFGIALAAGAGFAIAGASAADAAPVGPISVGDFSFTADDNNVNAGATLTGYTGSSTDVAIPSTVDLGGITYSVTTIGYSAFFDNTGLTSVSIPDSVTTIGDGAFDDDTSLASAPIPRSVTSIGETAFYNTALTSVSIPDGVTSVSSWAFALDGDLVSVSIPDSVTSIGDEAFYYDQSLVRVPIPYGVTSIGDFAFYYDSALVSVSIPDSVTSIGIEAFYYDNSIASISIPSSVTSIGVYTFGSENALASVSIPESVTSIGAEAFYSDPDLTTVVIPSAVTTIGDFAFGYDSSLTNVQFEGPPPTSIDSESVGYPFGSGHNLTLRYDQAFDSSVYSGGFTSPTWDGYSTQADASVRFDMDGHGVPASPAYAVPGDAIAAPSAPTAAGFVFEGWYTDPALTIRANFAAPITSDVALYAKWVAASQAAPSELAVTGVSISPATLWIALIALLTGGALIVLGRAQRHSASPLSKQ